eukprot:199351-Rhodomonas_salina.1
MGPVVLEIPHTRSLSLKSYGYQRSQNQGTKRTKIKGGMVPGRVHAGPMAHRRRQQCPDCQTTAT